MCQGWEGVDLAMKMNAGACQVGSIERADSRCSSYYASAVVKAPSTKRIAWRVFAPFSISGKEASGKPW